MADICYTLSGESNKCYDDEGIVGAQNPENAHPSENHQAEALRRINAKKAKVV